MLGAIVKDFGKYTQGYEYKSVVDRTCKKNMDAYTANVFSKTYLPQYSAREHELDYNDRLARAENAYLNFPERIVAVYQNAVYRSGEPTRESEAEAFKRFIRNADGAGTAIGKMVRDEIFVYNEIHGGCFVVIDKPRKADNDTMTVYQQKQLNFYPYAYIYPWTDLVNFGVDRYRRLDWVLFREAASSGDRDSDDNFRYFDKNSWAVLDKEGVIIDRGDHKLGEVPVIQAWNKRNALHRFLTPKSTLDDVIRLSLKIFEYQSQLEQMIINHIFMKLAMPEGMFKSLENGAAGNKNVFVFPDDVDTKAYYIEAQMNEIKTMIDMVYNQLPNKILYFATLRDKVEMPREESGVAKFVDSADEISNLLDKANSMELVENEMARLALKWEGKPDAQFKIVYNKFFDIKTTNQQIEEIVQIFKQDMGSPAFNKMIVKRLMLNMLGHVTDTELKQIENDLDFSIDPSLSIADIDSLTVRGLLLGRQLARKYNTDLREKSDDQVDAWIGENIKQMVGVMAAPTDNTGTI